MINAHEKQAKMLAIINKANDEKTLHLIISSARGIGRTYLLENIKIYIEDALINIKNVPFGYKYGVLLFDEGKDEDVLYYSERCLDGTDLASGLVAFFSEMPDFKNIHKFNIHRL